MVLGRLGARRPTDVYGKATIAYGTAPLPRAGACSFPDAHVC